MCMHIDLSLLYNQRDDRRWREDGEREDTKTETHQPKTDEVWSQGKEDPVEEREGEDEREGIEDEETAEETRLVLASKEEGG